MPAETTKNRMELMAAISGLGALKRRCSVKLYTDSKYVLQGITEWLPQWKARGWRTAAREPVKNKDLWEKLDAAAAAQDIEWHWVKGHSGHEATNMWIARQSGDRSDAGGALKSSGNPAVPRGAPDASSRAGYGDHGARGGASSIGSSRSAASRSSIGA